MAKITLLTPKKKKKPALKSLLIKKKKEEVKVPTPQPPQVAKTKEQEKILGKQTKETVVKIRKRKSELQELLEATGGKKKKKK